MAGVSLFSRGGSRKVAAPEPVAVPSLEDVSDEYRDLVSRRQTLRGDIASLEREEGEVTDRLRELQANGRLRIGTDFEAAAKRAAQVAELVGDAPPTPEDNPALRLSQIRERLTHLREAARVIEERIQPARRVASLAACAQMEPIYRDRVAALCWAMVELHKANLAYAELIDAFDREEIAWSSLTPLTPSWLGNPRDLEGRIPRYIREAREAGYVGPEIVAPASLHPNGK